MSSSKSKSSKRSALLTATSRRDRKVSNTRRVENESGYISMIQSAFEAAKSKHEKLTMNQYSSLLGVDPSVMSRVMSGLRPLNYKTALRILPRLNLSAKQKEQFMESIARSAQQLDAGAVSIEHAKRKNIAIEQPSDSDVMVNRRMAKSFGSTKGSVSAIPHSNADDEKLRMARAVVERVVVMKSDKPTRYIVTTAVQGAEIHTGFANAIDFYLKETAAKLIVLPLKAHLKPLQEREYPLDPKIHQRWMDCIYNRVQLGPHLHAVNLDIRPYLTDPLAGISALGAKDGISYIFGHPQQRLKPYPHGFHKYPRLQLCTGVVTLPTYRDNKPGLIADKNHVIGAIIVEVHGEKFFVRQIQADELGGFTDLGTYYSPKRKKKKVRALGLTRGDEHGGPEVYGNVVANQALKRLTKHLQPRAILLHDLFDAATVSHHRAHSIKARLCLPKKIQNLDDELRATERHLINLKKDAPNDCILYVVPANHNEHLPRYLDEGRYVDDIINYKLALKLAYHYHVLNEDPLKSAIDPDSKLAHWIKRGETIRLRGITVSSHGDKGIAGTRGSVKADEIAFGDSSSGHSHSPEIRNGAVRVGTTSDLDQDYTVGSMSTWAFAAEAIYESGRQLIFIIEGQYSVFDENGKAFKKAA
ncbi:MAG: hypothetical protein EOP06_01240 [Proteobacteria bacterium]|nr:MAG: hypothetical protein EOP06_01240 [Pseudomonadota bacterium]